MLSFFEILKRPILAAIGFYQREISPGLPRRCRYAPTCSAYAVGVLKTHGLVKGLILAGWRVLRCNPWSRGGVDRVPAKGQWPKKPLAHSELLAEWETQDNMLSSQAQQNTSD